jgi:hypothetical protein
MPAIAGSEALVELTPRKKGRKAATAKYSGSSEVLKDTGKVKLTVKK